jgi:hypothetical protein
MRDELSWETGEKTSEYKTVDVVHKISPRPLLLSGAHDDACPIKGYEKLHEKAGASKKLAVLPIPHCAVYCSK